MAEINIDELLKVLPRLIRENDTVKGAIITALSGVVATREDIKDLMREMDRRFEKMDKRFEQMDKRFEQMQKQMDKRFEQMDKRFEHVDQRLDEIAIGAAESFEVFCMELMKKLGKARGHPIPFLEQRRHFRDPEYRVHETTTDVEIDIFSPDPIVIGEVCYRMRDLEKLEAFTRKITFLESRVLKEKSLYRFFCTLEIPAELRSRAEKLASSHGIELLTKVDLGR
jgi:hypothetical protein